jgi:hypothetical protein
VVVDSQPGDVVCFTEEIWHASFGGGVGRPQHAVSWTADIDVQCPTECAYFRTLIEKYTNAFHYPPEMRRSPRLRIQSMIARSLEFGASPPRAAIGTYPTAARPEVLPPAFTGACL